MTSPNSGGAMTPANNTSRTHQIATLNDTFRSKLDRANIYVTLELVLKGQPFLKNLLAKVSDTSKTMPTHATDNERSFGPVSEGGVTAEWTIDYYGLDGEQASPDPSDPEKTIRTLTLEQSR